MKIVSLGSIQSIYAGSRGGQYLLVLSDPASAKLLRKMRSISISTPETQVTLVYSSQRTSP